jgi:rubrerythrin
MSPSEPYSVGEQPGKGVYACEECGSHVTVREDSDELPSCNICDNDDEVEYIQIS